MKTFSDLISRNELADFLRVKRSTLTYLLYKKEVKDRYSVFTIPKKNGGNRELCAPSEDLKAVQRKLASALWLHQKNIWKDLQIRPNISHAFEKKKSIITNAKIHKNKRFILNMDIEDFFDSFHFGRVKGFFEKNRHFNLPHEVAVTIAQIACYERYLPQKAPDSVIVKKICSLPQGAPTSPIITNLICQIMDRRLLAVAKNHRMDYTRYADDLTFSTNCSAFLDKEEQDSFEKELVKEINNFGFKINEKKTRWCYKSSKQQVTGLTVNKKLSVNKEFVKTTRAMAHRLYTKGDFEIDGKSGTIAQLEGRFTFIDQLDHHNNRYDGEKHDFRRLNSREKQYQAFLFYKYFFAHEKPLIVTEGKTDVRYLKAALKARCQEYSELIKRFDENKYEFKVAFLNRTKRLNYFFGLNLYGADTMVNIYNHYTKGTNCNNLFSKFHSLCNNSPSNPVILLYDNDEPVNSLLNREQLKNNRIQVKNCGYSLLIPQSGLYVAVPPLIHGNDKCEIEDLLPKKVLEHKIEGKSFCIKDKFDNEKYYGKEILSKYVLTNYKSIDFSGFKPLLDILSIIVSSYKSSS
jgi:RNA-directed DNA polymerase